MWDTWSLAGWYEEKVVEATAKAFDNPDWPDVSLHSCRYRWGLEKCSLVWDTFPSASPAAVVAAALLRFLEA